jgi:ribose transport system substrate-binding protein
MTIHKTALLAAIATISLAAPAFAADLTSIGMTVGNLGNPFFLSMQKGAQAKANELAGSKVEVTAVSSDYDLNKQSNQIDNFIASGVDMVLLNAADPTAIEPAMVRLKAAGITSVALDVTARGGRRTGPDRQSGGGTECLQVHHRQARRQWQRRYHHRPTDLVGARPGQWLQGVAG